MKIIYRDLIILILSIVISVFFDIAVDDFFMGTIYTVSGIMFSIGISILVTFNLHGIKKQSLIEKVRKNINKVRNIFIYYFSFSSLIFMVERYLRKTKINEILVFVKDDVSVNVNLSFVVAFLIFYCIFYFILNFLEVQKLNNEIFDESIL